MEHQGLISRPGLQGTEQDTLLTSTGLSAAPREGKKEQLWKLLKNLTTQQRRGQSVHVNTKRPCDFIHIPRHHRAIFLKIHQWSALRTEGYRLHLCYIALLPSRTFTPAPINTGPAWIHFGCDLSDSSLTCAWTPRWQSAKLTQVQFCVFSNFL